MAASRVDRYYADQGFLSGGDGTRTHDFLLAKQVL
jgi:hypothetical protein